MLNYARKVVDDWCIDNKLHLPMCPVISFQSPDLIAARTLVSKMSGYREVPM